MKRYLITTALEETWSQNGEPVLFLGEWCRKFDRQHVWFEKNGIVASYHWDDRQKLYRDYKYLQEVFEHALEALGNKLNKVHRVNHSLKYWRVLLGPWLGQFVQTLFDRWYSIQQAVRDYDISGICVLERSSCELVPHCMSDFHAWSKEDNWNELIYTKILERMQIPFKKIVVPSAYHSKSGSINTSVSFNYRMKSIVSRLFSLLAYDDEYFLITTYLGLKNDLKLQIRLGQFPKLWLPLSAPNVSPSFNQRNWQLPLDTNYIENEEYKAFLALLSYIIPQQIPTIYLEGYHNLLDLINKQSWPKNPKAIFDSISIYSNDVFKAWAAEKIEDGVSLIVGQHGGSYGISLWNFVEDHQIAVSNRFLTWGWSDFCNNNVTPVGNFKDFSKKVLPDQRGVALMVGMGIPRYSFYMSSISVSAGQWLQYLNGQFRFVESLPEKLRRSLLVRPYLQDYGYQQLTRWRSHYPEIALDDCSQPIIKLLKRTRIFISTYNSTTYMESLTYNFPTIMFWNPSHAELRDSAKPYFELLKSVGIFHESPESAALQLTSIWDDVNGWWQSKVVQDAREKFCNCYSTMLPDMIGRIKEILVEESGHAGHNSLSDFNPSR